jgi:Zn finger protein HypA/HybF involved in hydrogenase expression
MAHREICENCKKEFTTNRITWRCDECSGRTEERRKEETRWNALTPDEKCDELRDMLIKFVKRRRLRYHD